MTEEIAALIEFQNTTWLLVCAGLVLFMQAGFCFLEAGMVRSKNSINVAVKNISDFCISSVIYWIIGFAIMFGHVDTWIDVRYLFFSVIDSPHFVSFFIFQAAFCGTAATILSGGIAERASFAGYLIMAAVTAAIIHPVFGRLAWNGMYEGEANGWLNSRGFIDFSGASVIHSIGGWIALAAIIVIGPRIGRFTKGLPPIQGHNIPMATVGVIILWFGWMGFNGGSSLSVDSSIAKIILNTNIAAAASATTTLALSWILTAKPGVKHILNGALAGLVSVTACCDSVLPYEAAVIGIIGGCVYLLADRALEVWELDDAVGVVPVHAFCGVWGTLCVAFFGDSEILATGLSFSEQLWIQIEGVVICFLWGFGCSYSLLYLINKFIPLRVSRENEIEGLNVSEHSANTEVLDLLYAMEKQKLNNDFSQRVYEEPNTEVGQIANGYNRVLDKVNEEIKLKDKKNEELEASFKKLKEAQQMLIEAEKMAALGGLVSGIAHEINTPVGICITAESFLEEKTKAFTDLYSSGKISKQSFESYIEYVEESSDLISSNLQHAAYLINRFKLIDVTSKEGESRNINLIDFINEVVMASKIKISNTRYSILLDGPDDLVISINADALYKVLYNLIDNSVVHGFESLDKGEVKIRVFQKEAQIYIEVVDNGKGMAEEDLEKIFEPFFTTKRGQGSSGGLGMYIVFNLVTQNLKGKIECNQVSGGGMKTEIILPID